MDERLENRPLNKSQLINCVFKPLLFYLRVNGFSVPTMCTHKNSNTRFENGPFTSIDDDKKSKRTGKDLLRRWTKGRKAGDCFRCKVTVHVVRFIRLFVGTILVLNSLRYFSVFSVVADDSGSLVSAMNYQIFFIVVAYIYISTAYKSPQQYAKLISRLQLYERTFGTVVDCKKFHRMVLWKVRFFFLLQGCFSVGFVIAEQTIFPSLQIHLAPFSAAHRGAEYYVALMVFAIVLYFIGSIVYCLFGLFVLLSYILTKEFKQVSKDMKKIFRLRKGAVFRVREPGQLLCKKENALDDVKSHHTVVIIDKETSSEELSGSNEGNSVVDEVYSLEYPSQSPLKFLECPSQSPLKFLECPSQPPLKVHLQTLSSNPADQHATAFEQENKFDVLRQKHQALCEMIKITNAFARHALFLPYGSGIPLNCFIIYGLASGSLDLANILFQVWNVIFSVFLLCTATISGIYVNDAAHAPQAVLYAADWSHLPDSLIHKMQLFASRLGHVKIGYDVYGLFVIDKSTVLMVVGTLITYAVVVVQFQQGQGSCVGHTNSTAT